MNKKYYLPESVVLIDDTSKYTKETKLRFNDLVYGEFISSFKALQDAQASTHPKAIAERRAKTNLEKYGNVNAGATKEARRKAKDTMLQRYGVDAALKNKDILSKALNTLNKNYGVDNPMRSDEIKAQHRNNMIDTYGVPNPMQIEEIRARMAEINPFKSRAVQERILDKKNLKGIRSSKDEIELFDYVKSLGYSPLRSKVSNDTRSYQIDVLVKEKNLGIEYNGTYYHSEWYVSKNYHLDKYNACKNKGMKLLQFFDYEWLNRKEQVKGFIKSALGNNEIKVAGRKTELRIVDKEEAKVFLDNHHILGSCNFSFSIGLYYNNELLLLTTFGKHHRNKNELILSRLCGKNSVTVQGGLDKICNYVRNNYGTFYTWIDLRMSNGEGWLKSGWSFVHQLPPDYFYYHTKKRTIVSKQSRQKKLVGTPEGMTEFQHAEIDGLIKVWDCGKIKLQYK